MNQCDLSVIIVNWNTAALLLGCLETVVKNCGGISSEIIVVDNGSSDGSVEAVKRNYPQITLIENSGNLGFARANNLALAECVGKYAVLLNTDTRLQEGVLDQFLGYMDKNTDVAACCGQLLNNDGSKQNSFSVFPSLATELLNKSLLKLLLPRWYPSKRGAYMEPVDIDAVIGACMVLRMTDVNEIGHFDEDYYFFFEETDWCRRAATAGRRIVFVPYASIVHLQGQSVAKDLMNSSVEYFRSRYIYFKKNKSVFVRFFLRIGLMLKLIIDLILNCVLSLVSLCLCAKYCSKVKILSNLLIWHLRLCPGDYGLRHAAGRAGEVNFSGGKMSLSVCVITFNEESNIRDCLESVKWADEIIVLDSYSTDRTVEIAKGYTDKVYQTKWVSFSHNKNLCIEKASKEWVIVIDADERMTPELANEICSLKEDSNGYFIARKNFFLGQWVRFCGWYPDYSIRLFKNGKGRFRKRAVHEAMAIDGKTGKLKNPLFHYTYVSIRQFIDRLNRYSTLAAEEMLTGVKRPCKQRGIDVFMNIVLRPLFTFLKMYVFKLGFLEGKKGFIISSMYAYYVFLKYSKLRERVK